MRPFSMGCIAKDASSGELCACLLSFYLLTWTCCSLLSSRGKLVSFWSPLCSVRLRGLLFCNLVACPAAPVGFVSDSFSHAHNACPLASAVMSWSEAYSLLSCMSHNSRDKGRQFAECLDRASLLWLIMVDSSHKRQGLLTWIEHKLLS